ncbi:hypothetical protein NEUTE1DRAFT_102208 [Neurospora tetrasperma FGSC 2508]|uniref:Uncharacterized protein n=1 Tax=Neurospora tetrasperma (strain FGSC 2508 / ATCC MYA-4615 / P0657) TaxID=510951 RepID=F8MNI6_NEUT8|nr:uncharacterized protein NEUTE1DRAFT_102208 [Neurospora tetrasperma FGSC 2508]EGO56954.1 hypothetical protein NEUTE1DRAFT_102208 [Neurospora tetrasperma FGSC 2508]
MSPFLPHDVLYRVSDSPLFLPVIALGTAHMAIPNNEYNFWDSADYNMSVHRGNDLVHPRRQVHSMFYLKSFLGIIHYFCVLHLPTACEILDHDFHSHPSVQQLLQFCFVSKAFYHAVMPHIFKHVPLSFHEFDCWPQCLQFWSSNETEDLRVKVRRLKIAVKSHGISKYCFVEKNTPQDQALALSAAKERQLRALMVDLMNQLELPMVGLPSLRELIFSVDTFTNVYSDDFVVNRTIPDLVLRIVRDFGCALSNGRFDHLTSLRVKAPADQLVEILLDATRSKQLCVNLKTVHCDRCQAIGSVENQDAVMAAEEAVLTLVELCPNLKELCLFTFHEMPQLHPENTGLDKLIVGRVLVKKLDANRSICFRRRPDCVYTIMGPIQAHTPRLRAFAKGARVPQLTGHEGR